MQAPSAPGNGAPAGYQATGHWSDESDQPNVCEERSIRCRLCEEYVPTHWVKDHSKVCAVADRCDQKGFSMDERLIRVAETLEKLVESYSLADYPGAVSHNGAKVSNSSINEESNGQSSKLSDWSTRGSANMPDCIQETDNTTSTSYDDIINLPPVTCETPRSSAGSMTPRSPLITPRSNHIDMLSAEKSANNENDELLQVLRKADIVQKIFAESILTERDILITVRNPFVVRFFYSFTSRENLYLVMEYLNGGNLYSLLRNHGCLDEEVARLYLAEVVLGLEYLHFLHIVHRDLKPDNLFIAHDGHIKLTEFGLSKVGLIDSTKDMPDTVVSGAALYQYGDLMSELKHPTCIRKRSAAGTPGYLAPELLLGTGCGTSADWWSVGVILFELIVGMPAFNAEHPQAIFDNILNRKIHWPVVPEKMSFEAQDLIDKLLTEDPHQRLGANGALEVKQHPFFKGISWDTLAWQKAAFVPSSDSAFDASCFTSRCSWNLSDETIYKTYDFEDSSDNRNRSSSCASKRQDGTGDCCCELSELESDSEVSYYFRNFSFKNLSQLASINYDLLTKEDGPAKSDT